MTPQELQKLIGKKVMVTYKGLILTGKLCGIAPEFKQRDALVLLPNNKKPTRFWAEKVKEIKP